MSFQIKPKRSAARRKRGLNQLVNVSNASQSVATFGSGAESDGSETTPQAREVTIISASPKPQTNEESTVKEDRKEADAPSNISSFPKTSQIARLIAKRQQISLPIGNPDIKEDTLFQYDISNCPEQADLERYNARPVKGFGEMMLMQMGWMGKASMDEKVVLPVPRPSRSGLGAKLSNLPKAPPARRTRGKEITLSNTIENSNIDPIDLQNGEDITADSTTTKEQFQEAEKRNSLNATKEQPVTPPTKRPRFTLY